MRTLMGLILASFVTVGTAQVPNVFQSGDTASAAEVNENFSDLDTRLQVLENAVPPTAGPRWKILDATGTEVGVPFFASLPTRGPLGMFDIGGYQVLLRIEDSTPDPATIRQIRGALLHVGPSNNGVDGAIDPIGPHVFFQEGNACNEPLWIANGTRPGLATTFGPARYGYIHHASGNVWIQDPARTSEVTTFNLDGTTAQHPENNIPLDRTATFACNEADILLGPSTYTPTATPGLNLGPLPFPEPISIVYE